MKNFTREFYRGNRLPLALGIVQTFISAATSMFISLLLQLCLDMVSGGELPFPLDLGGLALLTLLCLLLYVLSSLLDYFARPRFMARAMEQYKNYAYRRLSEKGIHALSGEGSSLYISALSNDAAAIESGYLETIFSIVYSGLLFLFSLGIMLLYSPLLTAVALVFSLLPLLASILSGSRLAGAELEVSEKNEVYMGSLRDSLEGFPVIKTFRAEVRMCAIFAEKVRELAKAKERSTKISILVDMCSNCAGILVQMGVFLVGAWLALSGRAITAGTLLLFVQLLNFVLSPISVLPDAFARRKAARALIKKLSDALDENIRAEGELEPTELRSGIELQNLSYSYEPGKPVLDNISFRFQAGKRYAIVGASGSGKSTLLNLLLASSPDYQGSILYDDAELRDIRSDSLYSLVGLVQQNVFIFNASIRDNVTMFSDFPEEAVQRSESLSGLTPLIAARGRDYLCGENGVNLSGGERQRISIARSLLKNSRVLLFDEATAALDSETAKNVLDSLLNLPDVTSVTVTHSLTAETLKKFDCILALKSGRIVEYGSFGELMENKNYFYSLFTLAQ